MHETPGERYQRRKQAAAELPALIRAHLAPHLLALGRLAYRGMSPLDLSLDIWRAPATGRGELADLVEVWATVTADGETARIIATAIPMTPAEAAERLAELAAMSAASDPEPAPRLAAAA